LKIEFVRMCENVIISAKANKQNYCSSNNYSITYMKQSESCFIQIQPNLNSDIQLNFTKIITSPISPHIGNFCKNQFIEVILNNRVYNLCGNWTQNDLSLLPRFLSENSSIIIRIYTDMIMDQIIQNSIGFCFTYQSFPKELCHTSSGWFEGPNYCYKVFNERKTWFEAQKTCKANDPNGNLASVTSQKIQKLFDHFLPTLNNDQNK